MYDLSEILPLSSALSLSLLALVPSVPCSFWEFSVHNLEQVDLKRAFWRVLLGLIYLGPLLSVLSFCENVWVSLPGEGLVEPFCKIIVLLWDVLAWVLPPELVHLRGNPEVGIFVQSYHIFLLFGLSVGIFLLGSNGSFVAAIFVCCFDSWSLWWGESDAPQLSPIADVYAARLLERAPFCCFQILIFQLKRLRLLSFLSWWLPQCDCLTSFLEDFHHASVVDLSSPSRLLWLDLRNPSNYLADYIVNGRSPYLNFDPPSTRFVQ